MKKFFLYASAVAAMLFAGSCHKEALKPASDGEVSVRFSLELPKAETKAMSQAETTDIVYYEIWNSDWTKQLYPVDNQALASVPVVGKKATVELTLIADQTYNFIFWAQNENCGAYNVNELKNVGVDYAVIGAEGNQDKFDAFYAVKTINAAGAVNETITLYRPFAQLNFGADTMMTDLGDVNVGMTYITVDRLATVFNTLTGLGENVIEEPVTFVAEGIATDEILVTNGQNYTWVAMDYMLMMDDADVVEVAASFNVNMDDPVEHLIANVPLKKNYRTNIVGDLFTTDAILNIILDPAFLKPDEDITVGVAEEPEFDAATNTWSIKTAGNVLWLAIQPDNFAAGKTISFDADIDMMGQGITPIMASSASTKNTQVLGNGHKVYNFIVKQDGKAAAGLFGTVKGNITDLHVEKATVNAEYMAGALVGYIYGSVQGCSVKNSKVTSVPYVVNGGFDGGNHAGGLIGYTGESNKSIYTHSGNLVDNVEVRAYRNVAAAIGTIQSGVIVKENTVRNSKVVLDQVTNFYGNEEPNAGKLGGRIFATAQLYDNTVENVTIETILPEWTMVNGVKTLALDGNAYLYDGQVLCETISFTEDYVVDGNGATVTFVPDGAEDMTTYTAFSSSAKNNVVVKNITFKGEYYFMTAGYHDAAVKSEKEKQFYTTFENVNFIDVKVAPVQIAQALFCDGVTVLNNCNIYGTQLSSYSASAVAVYDVATFNYSHTTINGGKYGVVGNTKGWVQATLVIDGAEIETVENYYLARPYAASRPDAETRGLYIKAGSKIKTVNTCGTSSTSQWTQLHIEAGAEVETLTFDANALANIHFTSEKIKIADGTVGKVVANGTEMTLAEFKAAYNL